MRIYKCYKNQENRRGPELIGKFIMASGTGNSLEAIEGVGEIHFNDYCRFWHNNFIGYISVTFTNFKVIPSWSAFIRLPFRPNQESITHLHDIPELQLYMGAGNTLLTMARPIPTGDHHFDLVFSLV